MTEIHHLFIGMLVSHVFFVTVMKPYFYTAKDYRKAEELVNKWLNKYF